MTPLGDTVSTSMDCIWGNEELGASPLSHMGQRLTIPLCTAALMILVALVLSLLGKSINGTEYSQAPHFSQHGHSRLHCAHVGINKHHQHSSTLTASCAAPPTLESEPHGGGRDLGLQFATKV